MERGLDDGRVRLDKWLWAARFFKTRQLAHEAIELGRVLVGGERVKASRVVREGDELIVRQPPVEYRVTVLALATQRRPAAEARLMYRESEESAAQREQTLALARAERASFPHGDGRPTKKARRDIIRFKSSY
ncbi:RNA-binding S4 domain-containing protein [Paludibacterium paludis]|uniref:Heat shock protein 15 n=1 Tax=Paludibacterium paludis TaxID=1225769 RepID=A0A918NYX2_9NEIS|nr:S4 domain-containing protein [Paludibacterium paludis]GGY06853.1 heat shock protein 15 [Paludibacterium paludis]